MHKRKPALSKGGGTAKWLSETLKIQAEGAGFLAKSNLCSSEAELGGIDRRKLSKSKLTRVNPLSHGVPPCQLPLLMGASRLCANILFCIVQEFLSDDKEKNEKRSLSLRQEKYNLLVEIHYPKGITV